MTIHESIQDRLSDYLDEELTDGDRTEVEAHLASCAECSTALAELKQVVALAASLPAPGPSRDLWRGVEARLGSRTSTAPPRRFSFTLPEIAAASLMVAALSGGAVALLTREAPGRVASVPAVGPATADRRADAEMPLTIAGASSMEADVVPAVGFADVQFEAAVLDLERALEGGRDRLDPETILVVEENLAIIDRAIAEARGALASDPSNGYLSRHLMEARRKKLDLLRRAATIGDAN
jgi:hypothetical protein